MIDLEYIKSFFPEIIRNNRSFSKMMLKEYLQLMILDYISTTKYAKNLVFIGGTNLRIIHGIDRFSEDLDFDCKNLDEDDFMTMTMISWAKETESILKRGCGRLFPTCFRRLT